MDRAALTALLHQVASGSLAVDAALERIGAPSIADLGYAQVDLQRERRTGLPEAIFGEGKSAAQITGLLRSLHANGQRGLATRVDADKAAAVQAALPEVVWRPVPRLLEIGGPAAAEARGTIAVVAAGTSDLPVAEEAACVAEFYGNPVLRVTDVGVAGIHRLFHRIEALRACAVVVVVAGMEGALAGVVAGLVRRPVLAVPTSVGYGASFQGLAPLLTMLNACAPGISVLNIDNGYGAAVQADQINRLAAGLP
jgi:pyridinium-3,5-biscarboxylic acid mononucleotide synthase